MKIRVLDELRGEVGDRKKVVRVLSVDWIVLQRWRRSMAAGGAAVEAWRLSVHVEESLKNRFWAVRYLYMGLHAHKLSAFSIIFLFPFFSLTEISLFPLYIFYN